MDNKIKLLIVDDEINFLNSIAERLEIRDFDVVKASNGKTAISAISSGDFDFALVDLKMPGLDGKQLLEYIKTNHAQTDIIILTGHASLELAEECMKKGAAGYLLKPFEIEELLDLINLYIEKKELIFSS